jgi:hypothetical protein
MPATLKQVEDAPFVWPAAPAGLSAKAAALDPVPIWRRLESFCAWRWGVRDVAWTVEGPGLWTPPLAPAQLNNPQVWTGDGWANTVLPPSPLGGYELASEGPYRITATVGAATVPADVQEAFRRLAEYTAAESLLPAGVRSYSATSGQLSEAATGDPAWLAKALHNSGAADLLRPYRRA